MEITFEDGRKSIAQFQRSRSTIRPPGAPAQSGGLREQRCRRTWSSLFALVLNGVMIGLMYALIALGFVLVYKATDAINFAQGEFVMFAGLIAAAVLASRRRAVLVVAVIVALAA